MEDEWNTIKEKKKPKKQQQPVGGQNQAGGRKKGGVLVAGAVNVPQAQPTESRYGGRYGGRDDDYNDYDQEEEKEYVDYSNKGASAVADHDFGIYNETKINVEKVSHKCAKAIQDARLAAKLSQSQLASKVNEKVHTIVDVENGTARYNADLINRIEKALGVQIPRGRRKKK